MHSWGDGFQYFGDVENAASNIGNFCRRWGRINISQTKEKYGTARVYVHFGTYDLHGLIWPGYAYIQYPKFYHILTFRFLLPFASIIHIYQKFIYKTAYLRMIKKYPHIRDEICDGADYSEFILTPEERIEDLNEYIEKLQDKSYKRLDLLKKIKLVLSTIGQPATEALLKEIEKVIL